MTSALVHVWRESRFGGCVYRIFIVIVIVVDIVGIAMTVGLII